jgi:serine/threonine-protein kinase
MGAEHDHLVSRWRALETATGVDPCGRTFRPDTFVALSDDPAADTAAVMQHITSQPPCSLPRDDYELAEEIGRGGMGVIFRAHQPALQRQVAVKRLRDEVAELWGPFVAEAQVLGRLEHPGIVPVHALRADDGGAPLMAMKLVDGASWRELIAGGTLELDEHLRILQSVCHAVSYAHSRGILHRDIKPANVMVGDFAQVYLMDWGIAIAMHEGAAEGTSITHRETVDATAGTPGYMAPELARGIGDEQDERTDVYLLGACLHEILTGNRRHDGETMRDVLLAAVASKSVPYPDDVPRELAAMCNRATACDKDDRYRTVLAFNQALDNYLENRQARALLAEAQKRVDDLREARDAFDRSAEAAREIHRLHAEAHFALEHATATPAVAKEAKATRAEVGKLILAHAIDTDDLALADRALLDCDDDDTRAEVASLRERQGQRHRELEHLREDAQRRKWSTIATPLSTLFLTTAALGGAAALVTSAMFHSAASMWMPIAVIWMSIALLSGATAFVLLRGKRVPDNLVSPRVIGLWAAVALGCIITGGVAQLTGGQPFSNAGYQSAMIGIGFTAMALQTRLSLLWPAATFYVGAGVMWPEGAYNVEIFGALWFVAMATVGIALRLGARLDPVEA